MDAHKSYECYRDNHRRQSNHPHRQKLKRVDEMSYSVIWKNFLSLNGTSIEKSRQIELQRVVTHSTAGLSFPYMVLDFFYALIHFK
ncbi:hypothetical protein KIN20_036683 [Parelaphostrongylus tenuis]|uniref:Uncharacterized protein n=1 Tax=Parelaphostrongylus tenuis TaxID=148309 RepID=A0AAD5RDI0_PARTN|nr:hypothetical protein KIN20_036683 [Parelaphostrongylus tenuis]